MEEQYRKLALNKTIQLNQAKGVDLMDIKWFWEPYIPRGMITFLEGDPGVGKSYISIQLAADVSQGRALPGQAPSHARKEPVIMFTGEEPLEVMRSRLEAAGADVELVWLSDSIFPLKEKGLADLEQMITETGAGLVFMDPLQSFVNADLDINNAKDMQQMLRPLAKVADKTGAAIVIIRHLRKSGGKNAKHSGLGSISLTGIARSVIQAGETRGGNKILSHVKYNYSSRGPTLHYDFKDGTFRWAGTWSDEEHTGGQGPRASKKPSKAVQAATDWLLTRLRDGASPMVDVIFDGAEAGFSKDILNNAKKSIAVSRKIGAVWHWELKELLGEGEKPSTTIKPQRTPEENTAIETFLKEKED